MPVLNIISEEDSDVLRGVNYHKNLPEKEREALQKKIDGYIHTKSLFYPDSLTGVISLPDYLEKKIEEETEKEMDKLSEDFDNDFDDDFSEEDEEIEDDWDPIPNLGIDFD